MNQFELRLSWQVTRQHLAAARALLTLQPREDFEEGGRVSFYDAFLAHNELELVLDTLETLGMANDGSPSFWQELTAAAQNMNLQRHYPRGWEGNLGLESKK